MTANPTNLTSIGLRPGDKIDKYEVIEQIGAGGFSVVWKAYDRLLDKHVAVKQVTVDPSVDEDTFRERFRSEAVIQKKAAQEHKNLVRIIDFIEEPRGLFIIMEYVNGPSLEHLLAQNPGPVELKTALGIAAAAAVALGALHDKGIVHRDLKPANILLPAEGGLKICDFGLASLMADQETPAVGTVRYMAPELLDGKAVDGRADLYSLGIMLYEMLIGRANFEDSFKTVLRDQRNVALRWMKWHTNSKIKATPMRQYVPTIPESIALLVERMIEKDPNQRIASASQLIEAMRRQLANPGAAGASAPASSGPAAGAVPSTFATPGAVGDKTVKLKKKNKVVLIAAITVVLWSIVGIGYLLMSQSKKNAEELQRQSVVHADYREALKLFGQEKWDEASLKFKAMLETHAGYTKLPVPVAGNERKPMETAVAGHLYFCDARREFSMQNYDKTIDLLNKAEAASAIDLGKIDALRKEADILNRIGFKEQAIAKLVEEGKFFAAKHEWLKFRSDGFYKFLSEEQQRRWDDLGPKISARQEESEAQSILAEARSLEENNRSAAIALLEDWKAKNPDNPNRMISAYITALKGAVDFETAVARGKSAEQRMDYPGAIDSYERALDFNRKVGEEMGLPSLINKIKGRVAFNQGKAAFDANDIDGALLHLNNALSYIPDMAEAKTILKQIDSAGQMASLRRQAVTAHQSGEYEKAINLWTRLRDEFEADPTEIAGEIAKAQFQISVRKMDLAWSGDDDASTLKTIDEVLAQDPAYERATTLKTLIETRRRIRNLIAAGDKMRTKGEYADAKRELRRAQDVAKTITDATIREQLLSEATRQLDDVEYLDLYSKAKRDFELNKLDTARANVLGAIKTKKTDEAQALLVKIQAALDKKQVQE